MAGGDAMAVPETSDYALNEIALAVSFANVQDQRFSPGDRRDSSVDAKLRHEIAQ
jgi:hypothetical protein